MKERKHVRREIAHGATATVAEDAAPETIKALEECVRCARDGIGAFPVAAGSASSMTAIQKLNRALLRTLMSPEAADIVAERLEEIERENLQLRQRVAILDWTKKHVGKIDFEVLMPEGVTGTNPWIACGHNFEAAVIQAKEQLATAVKG